MKSEGKLLGSIMAVFFVLTLIASTALAVTTYMQAINYQGRLAESGGALVNGPVSMTFAIYNTPSGGAPLWSETQPSVTVTDGAFSVVLGSVNPIDLPFDEQYYLGVQVESDVEMSPRAFLLSVPYAMRAAEVDAIAAGSVTSNEIADGAVTSTKVSAPIYLSSAGLVPTIESKNTGFGKAGQFTIDNASSGAQAISATTNGNSYAVYGLTTGTGVAGRFEINNAGNDQPALEAITNGSNYAIKSINTGSTYSGAGYFLINNATSTAPALRAQTYGTGRSGYFSGGAGVYVNGNLDVGGTISGNGSGLSGIQSTHDHDADYVNASGDDMTGRLSVTSSGGLDAVYGKITAGSGRAGHFEVNNTASDGYALYATTNGAGGAVYGSTTGTGKAGSFQIHNTASNGYALYATTTGTGYAGYFEGGMGVVILGDLIVAGTKNFIQPHPTDPTKQVAYVSIEAPESAVMIRGKARLVDGEAVIETPEYFRVVAGLDEDITVQFTPRFENTIGLAAVEVTKDRIVVKERMGGRNSYEFDYLITAKRAGFEGHEPIQPNTNFTADMKTAEEFEQAYAKDDITSTAMRKLLVSNGILTADGKLNMELAKEMGWVVKDSDVAVK